MKPRAVQIGHRVRYWRRRAGLTQIEVARAVGYSASNVISKLEAGRMPSVEAALLLDRIAGVTGTDLVALLHGTGGGVADLQDRSMRDDVYPRALEVHGWLKLNKQFTSRTIAERFDISPRHAQRTVEFLRDRLHAPIEYDRQRATHYYTDPTFELPELIMTEGEAVALLVAHESILRRQLTPLSRHLLRALDGLKKLLPDSVSVAADDLVAQTSFVSMPARPVEARILDGVTQALQRRKRIFIDYYGAHGDNITKREVDIYHLTHRWTDWYMVGYCHLRQDLRTFALSRIKTLHERAAGYEIPPKFSAEEYFRSSMGIETGQPRHVRLHVDKFEARWIRERVWHPSQHITEQKDGSIMLDLQVGLTSELEQWIMSYGRHVRVVEPPELADVIHKEHATAAQVYSSKKPVAGSGNVGDGRAYA